MSRKHAYSVEFVELDQIQYRGDFSGPRFDPERVKELVEDFQAERVLLGAVNIRDDGTIISLDGEHTTKACQAMGWSRRRMMVFRGKSAAWENRYYAEQHDHQKLQHPTHVFVLKADAGDNPQKEILDIVGSRIWLTQSSRYTSGPFMRTVKPLREVYDEYGGGILDDTVGVLAAWDRLSPKPITHSVFKGVADFLVRGRAWGEPIDIKRLVKALKPFGKNELDRYGKISAGMDTGARADHESTHVAISQQLNRLYHVGEVRRWYGKRGKNKIKIYLDAVSDSVWDWDSMFADGGCILDVEDLAGIKNVESFRATIKRAAALRAMKVRIAKKGLTLIIETESLVPDYYPEEEHVYD